MHIYLCENISQTEPKNKKQIYDMNVYVYARESPVYICIPSPCKISCLSTGIHIVDLAKIFGNQQSNVIIVRQGSRCGCSVSGGPTPVASFFNSDLFFDATKQFRLQH